MKKILATLLIFGLFVPASAEDKTAGGVCEIEQIPKELQSYIKAFKKDYQAVVTKLKREHVKKLREEKEKKKDQSLWDNLTDEYDNFERVTLSKLKRIGNILPSWDGFKTDFNFWIGTGIDFTPSQVYRDHDYIAALSESVKSLIISLDEQGANPHKEFTINGIAISLDKLYDQNNELLSKYKKAIIKKTPFGDSSYNEGTFYYISAFTKEKIEIKFDKYQSAFDNCEQKDYITEITRIFKGGFNNIWEDWETAIRLSQGLDGDFENEAAEKEYRKIEKELLKKELSKQGLSSSQAALILKNLDNANTIGKNGEVEWSHANRLNIFSQGSRDEFQLFKKSLAGIVEEGSNFLDKLDNSVDVDNLTEGGIREIIDYKEDANRLTIEIAEIYEKEKLTISKGSKASEEIVSNVRDIHREIVDALENLKVAREHAVKVCQDAASNKSKNCK